MSRAAIAVVGIALLAFLTVRESTAQGAGSRISMVSDWSHQHLVFSAPQSIWHAWRLQSEPRYWHQWSRQNEWALRSANLNLMSDHAHRDDGRDRDQDNDRDDDNDRDHHRRDRGLGQGRNPLRRDWGMSLGNLGTVGAGQAPAKFGFDVSTASCTADYVAFTTSLVGSSTAPSIVAFDELYSTQGSVGGFCSQNGPSVKWAYNTNPSGDTTGTTLTSAAVSLDGTKVAFVESRTNANGGAILHILNWKPGAGATVDGTIAAPAAPQTTLTAGQNWTSNCPAGNSCISNIILSGAQPDTNSAPFVDYSADVIYVGDDNGVLHKITGVFLGAPAEVLTGGWPVTVHTGSVLTGPVFETTSRNIFVGDASGQLSFVKEAGSTVGTCALGSPPCLASVNAALGGSLVDSPIVDSSTGRVLVVDGTDTNNGSAYQFDTGLTAGSKVTANIGGSGAGSNLYSGAFDDAYFSVGPGSGHLYTCGKDSANTDRPAIYQLTFTSSGMLNTSPGTALKNLVSANGAACSPVTEFLNGATDRIFFSVTNSAFAPIPIIGVGTATGCQPVSVLTSSGCVMSIALGGAWPPATTTAGIPASGGSSGIVVDNVGAGAQESSLYYTYLSNSTNTNNTTCNVATGVGCAVKATQSNLN
jgi:hypothetical protein